VKDRVVSLAVPCTGATDPGLPLVLAAPTMPGLQWPAQGGGSQEHGICFQLGL